MTRPLYAGLDAPAQRQGHAGLWYEKYCDKWKSDPQWSLKAGKESSPKLDWIETVTGSGYADNTLLDEHRARQDALFTQRNAVVLTLKTVGRLMLGIGLDHPVENGFLWHPTLGVPYIPGSSIKGMLNAWLRDWLDDTEKSAWFRTANAGVGDLVFFDALPTAAPRLEADVVTPHYGPYYRDPATQPPADWHSPTPTPFLTVGSGASFTVAVAHRKGVQMADAAALRSALGEAFLQIGIGAKTAVGYGRLETVASRVPEPPRPLDVRKFVAGYVPLDRSTGKHGQLADQFLKLPPADQEAVRVHLRTVHKARKRDCKGRLAELLFPE